MLTTREGSAAASASKRVEDVSVNDLGDGGAGCVHRGASSRGRRKQAAPLVLVWFWRLEEDMTEETRHAVKVAGVLNNLNKTSRGT